MPNIVNTDGLTTMTAEELVDYFTAQYQAIYGADINLDQDTPDGQMMRIYVQSVLDVLDLITQVYNNFDPDHATGVVLDSRVAFNGIQRQAGTYTQTPISITVDRALTLTGLNDDDVNPYTVADNAGTQWCLMETQAPAVAGTSSYAFRAKLPGETLTTLNTITVPVSIVIGVTGINNPSTYTVLGINEETDAALKIRRQQSVSLSSQGYLQGLLAALLNVSGVTAAFVYENTTGSTDANDVPGHSIWCIVNGGDADDVAQAIYLKRNAGCGMKGDETVNVDQVDGSEFTVRFDYVEAEDLFIEFTATSINGTDLPDGPAIAAYIAANFAPGVAEQINVNQLATVVQAFDSNCLVTLAGLSTDMGGPFNPTLEPTDKNNQFSVDAANIDITVTPL